MSHDFGEDPKEHSLSKFLLQASRWHKGCQVTPAAWQYKFRNEGKVNQRSHLSNEGIETFQTKRWAGKRQPGGYNSLIVVDNFE